MFELYARSRLLNEARSPAWNDGFAGFATCTVQTALRRIAWLFFRVIFFLFFFSFCNYFPARLARSVFRTVSRSLNAWKKRRRNVSLATSPDRETFHQPRWKIRGKKKTRGEGGGGTRVELVPRNLLGILHASILLLRGGTSNVMATFQLCPMYDSILRIFVRLCALRHVLALCRSLVCLKFLFQKVHVFNGHV